MKRRSGCANQTNGARDELWCYVLSQQSNRIVLLPRVNLVIVIVIVLFLWFLWQNHTALPSENRLDIAWRCGSRSYCMGYHHSRWKTRRYHGMANIVSSTAIAGVAAAVAARLTCTTPFRLLAHPCTSGRFKLW